MRSIPKPVPVIFLALILGTLAGCMPLLEAAQRGNTEEVRGLLDAGYTDYMEGALWHAACEGYTEMAQLFLEKDAKRLESFFITSGNKPLQCAIERGHTETVALLLSYGAPPDEKMLAIASQKGQASIVRMLEEAQVSPPARPPQRPASRPATESPRPPLIY